MTTAPTDSEMEVAYDTLLSVAQLTTSPGDAYDIGLSGIVRRAIDLAPDEATKARVDAARATLAAHPQYAYLRDVAS